MHAHISMKDALFLLQPKKVKKTIQFALPTRGKKKKAQAFNIYTNLLSFPLKIKPKKRPNKTNKVGRQHNNANFYSLCIQIEIPDRSPSFPAQHR